MKQRTLWMWSALGLACGAVHAQSSVTLFGVVDLGVLHTRAGGVGSATALGNGGLSTSRIGFRGTEDLGLLAGGQSEPGLRHGPRHQHQQPAQRRHHRRAAGV
jgi:predicted porin